MSRMAEFATLRWKFILCHVSHFSCYVWCCFADCHSANYISWFSLSVFVQKYAEREKKMTAINILNSKKKILEKKQSCNSNAFCLIIIWIDYWYLLPWNFLYLNQVRSTRSTCASLHFNKTTWPLHPRLQLGILITFVCTIHFNYLCK